MTHPLQCDSQYPTLGASSGLHQYSIVGERPGLNFHGLQQMVAGGILGGLLMVLGCSPSPATKPDRPIEFVPAAALLQPLPLIARPLQRQARRLIPPVDPVTVDIYRLDQQCEGFIAEPVVVSRQEVIANTVGEILASQPTLALDLSGYRVSVDPDTKSATIDLRVSPESQRVLMSLSICEQLALFGSLRQTLLNHPEWGIDTVTITNRGRPLLI